MGCYAVSPLAICLNLLVVAPENVFVVSVLELSLSAL